MKKIQHGFVLLAIAFAILAIIFVLKSEHALITHPKGLIAKSELHLIVTNILIMLCIIAPTFVLLFWVAWKYRLRKNHKPSQTPQKSFPLSPQILFWVAPSLIVLAMAPIMWKKTHELDPYQPLKVEGKPLTIQVIALDWKWLFIYPEQNIASLNFVQIPEKTPIHFELAADDSPMNSFWIPQLSGQIYAMSGMITQLHLIADTVGVYQGRAAEINGEGFADMTFVVKSTTLTDFETWVDTVKKTPNPLTHPVYNDLMKKSVKNPITLYSQVENALFHQVVMKYMGDCCL